MLSDGKIMINGSELSLPPKLSFLYYFPYGNLIEGKNVDCSEGYFVLGDNSGDSDDSRFNSPIPRTEIVGRAWLYGFQFKDTRPF